MKKFYFVLLAFLFCTTAHAQVSITATNRTGGPFTTLKEAFDSINTGAFTGIINISITGNTLETTTATLRDSGNGSASYSSISITPSGGARRTLSGFVSGPLIDLNGADHVTIDGLDTAGNALTISNISTANVAGISTIRFIGDASHNAITNCTILGSGTSASSGSVLFSTALITGNNNNSISKCIIDVAGSNYPTFGVFCSGTTGKENSNDTIKNCSIANYYNITIVSGGLSIATGGTAWEIADNRFYQSSSRNYTSSNTIAAINIAAGSGHHVISNKIGHSTSTGGGIYTITSSGNTKFIGIELSVGTASPTSVQGNEVTAIQITSDGFSTYYGTLCGIYVGTGDVNVGTLQGNIIGATTGAAAMRAISTTSSGTTSIVGIGTSSTSSVVIQGNSIGAMESNFGFLGQGDLYGIRVTGAAASLIIKSNIVGNSTPNNMLSGGTYEITSHAAGISLRSASPAALFITGNTVQNITCNGGSQTSYSHGIYFDYLGSDFTNAVVNNNTITNVHSRSTASNSGLRVNTSGIGVDIYITNLTISGNIIRGIAMQNTSNSSNTGAASGIAVLGPMTCDISGNRISEVSDAGTDPSTYSPAAASGIRIKQGRTNGVCRVSNNMITIGDAVTTNAPVIGIWSEQTTVNNFKTNCYHNSVIINGASAASSVFPSCAFYRGSFSSTSAVNTVDIRNNIFINNRTGGTKPHYAIANSYGAATSSATGWAPNASNYNLLNAADTTAIGYWSGNWDFATWQVVSASDANSIANVPVFFADAVNADLHLASSSIGNQNLGGVGIPDVTIDYDNDLRDPFRPYKGADEASQTLPLKFLSFEGRSIEGANMLLWKASCSAKKYDFIVERSADGNLFSPIGEVSATGRECTQGATFIDKEPGEGISYYRLQLRDEDGSVLYSRIILLKEGRASAMKLYPTVTIDGHLYLKTSLTKQASVNIVISDLNGKVIIRSTRAISSGSAVTDLDVANLPNGSYQLSVKTADYTNTLRFVREQ